METDENFLRNSYGITHTSLRGVWVPFKDQAGLIDPRDPFSGRHPDAIEDGMITMPEYIATSLPEGQRIGALDNMFKMLGGYPNKDQSKRLAAFSQKVVDLMPRDAFAYSTRFCEYAMKGGKSPKTRIWSYDIPLYSANQELWNKAKDFVDYHDPENL